MRIEFEDDDKEGDKEEKKEDDQKNSKEDELFIEDECHLIKNALYDSNPIGNDKISMLRIYNRLEKIDKMRKIYIYVYR